MQATVILPTIAGRGALLPLSAGSVLAQSVADIELFIMGDGVDDAGRQQCHPHGEGRIGHEARR